MEHRPAVAKLPPGAGSPDKARRRARAIVAEVHRHTEVWGQCQRHAPVLLAGLSALPPSVRPHPADAPLAFIAYVLGYRERALAPGETLPDDYPLVPGPVGLESPYDGLARAGALPPGVTALRLATLALVGEIERRAFPQAVPSRLRQFPIMQMLWEAMVQVSKSEPSRRPPLADLEVLPAYALEVPEDDLTQARPMFFPGQSTSADLRAGADWAARAWEAGGTVPPARRGAPSLDDYSPEQRAGMRAIADRALAIKRKQPRLSWEVICQSHLSARQEDRPVRTKMIVVSLPPDEYEQLTRLAEANDRDPWFQAKHLIRAGLRHAAPGPAGADAPVHEFEEAAR
jgi:hypothetical protein